MSQNRSKIIAPSILSADFSCLGEEILDVERGGADWIHVDVMDGHFVPNLTIGAPVVKGIRPATRLPFDVHLMIENPERYIDDFRKAGSDWITVHVEASSHLDRTLKEIRESGAKSGLSLRPGTEIDSLTPFLKLVDLILVMTVEPGFGGQSFMPDMLKKIERLRGEFDGLISVDGGVNIETIRSCSDAGADVFVAGSAIFQEQDRAAYIRKLKQKIS